MIVFQTFGQTPDWRLQVKIAFSTQQNILGEQGCKKVLEIMM